VKANAVRRFHRYELTRAAESGGGEKLGGENVLGHTPTVLIEQNAIWHAKKGEIQVDRRRQ
jgi:hypothetical protein